MRQQMIVVLLTALFAGCGAFTLVPATATASATPTATSTFAPATATARALQQQINAVLFEATIVMATIYALSRSDAPRQQVGQDSDRLYRLARTRGREDARTRGREGCATSLATDVVYAGPVGVVPASAQANARRAAPPGAASVADGGTSPARVAVLSRNT